MAGPLMTRRSATPQPPLRADRSDLAEEGRGHVTQLAVRQYRQRGRREIQGGRNRTCFIYPLAEKLLLERIPEFGYCRSVSDSSSRPMIDSSERARATRAQLAYSCRANPRDPRGCGRCQCRRSSERDKDGTPPLADTPAPLELAVGHDLTLGDIPGEVRNRMGHVARRHRDDRNLRERTRAPTDPPRALENRREIAVQSPG